MFQFGKHLRVVKCAKIKNGSQNVTHCIRLKLSSENCRIELFSEKLLLRIFFSRDKVVLYGLGHQHDLFSSSLNQYKFNKIDKP
jgi:hypothetical protein